MRGSISLIRQRPSETSTSGGRSETERNALAVMPWIVSRWVVVTTVTPVAKRPMTLRSSRAAASAACERGVSRAMPVGAPSDAGGGGAKGVLPRPALGGGAGEDRAPHRGHQAGALRGRRHLGHPRQASNALPITHDRGRFFSGS